MKAVRKYTFERTFDAPVKKQQAAPTFTAEDLENARQAGYAEGEEAGRKAVLSSIEQATVSALDDIRKGIMTLIGNEHARAEQMKADAAILGHAIAGKLAPRLAADMPLAEIEGMVTACLASCYNEPRIVVRVADDLVDPLKTVTDELARAQGFAGKIILLGHEGMGGTDCMVEWADGGAEHRMERIEAEISRLVTSYVDSRRKAARIVTNPAEVESRDV